MKNGSVLRRVILMCTVLGTLLVPAVAFAHLERPSYWPDPTPDTVGVPGRRRQGARAALALLGGPRKGPRRGARGLPGPRRLEVDRGAAQVDLQGPQVRLPAAPEPAEALPQPARRARAALGEPRARAEVQVQRDPARHLRLGQQRPRRGPAGPLHRAHLARPAAQRPALRRHDPDGLGRRQDAELPVPGHLSERPEPDPHPGPRGAHTPPPSPPLDEPAGDPGPGPCVRCNLQLEGSGVEPGT